MCIAELLVCLPQWSFVPRDAFPQIRRAARVSAHNRRTPRRSAFTTLLGLRRADCTAARSGQDQRGGSMDPLTAARRRPFDLARRERTVPIGTPSRAAMAP